MKKILSLSLCIILLLSFTLTGCQKEVELTAMERYEKLMDASEGLDSAKMAFDGTMNMDMKSEDPAVAESMEMVAGMLENITFEGTAEYMKTDKIGNLGMVYKVNMNGMAVELELYFDGDKIIINYPMMPKYIVIDINELFGLANASGELPVELDYATILANINPAMDDLMKISRKIMMETLTEEDIEYVKEYTFTFKGEEIVTEAIKLNMKMDNMTGYLKSFMTHAKDVESFRNIADMIDTEQEVTMEVYNAAIDAGIVEMEASETDILAAYEQMNIEKYELVFGYDKDYNMTNYDANMAYDMYDETSKMNMKFNMTMSSTVSDHNGVTEVVMPVLDEENSMGIMEMMGGMY